MTKVCNECVANFSKGIWDIPVAQQLMNCEGIRQSLRDYICNSASKIFVSNHNIEEVCIAEPLDSSSDSFDEIADNDVFK